MYHYLLIFAHFITPLGRLKQHNVIILSMLLSDIRTEWCAARARYSSQLAVAVQSKAAYPLTYKDEMLGGFVTFDMFQAILHAKL